MRTRAMPKSAPGADVQAVDVHRVQNETPAMRRTATNVACAASAGTSSVSEVVAAPHAPGRTT
ncbi:MAG: hypothetical protein WKG00_35510 [Polyangiaceae bacterium]